MVNWNQWVLGQQKKNLLWVVLSVIALLAGFYLLVPKKAKPQVIETPLTVAGVVDESFSEADSESAFTQQQKELSALKTQLKSLQAFIELRANQRATQEPSDFEVPANVLSKINPTYAKGVFFMHNHPDKHA